MTRRDYVLLAEVLYNQYRRSLATATEQVSVGVLTTAEAIANALASDNKRFDREHFMAVVRGEKPVNSKP